MSKADEVAEWFDMRKFEMGINYLLEGDTVQLDKKYKIIEIGKGEKIGRVILRRYLIKYLWIPNENILKRYGKSAGGNGKGGGMIWILK